MHQVPDVVDDQLSTAKATLKQHNFAVTSQKANVAGKKAGTVVAQSPAAGTQLKEDSTVELTVASGLVDIPAKALIGKSYADAANILEKLGLNPARENQTSSKDAGTVIGVDPDSTAKSGSTVTLAVATTPPAPTYVPQPQPSPSDNGDKSDKGNGDKEKDDEEEDDKGKSTDPKATDQKSPDIKDTDE